MMDMCGEFHHQPPALFSLSALSLLFLLELAFIVLVLLVEQYLLIPNGLLLPTFELWFLQLLYLSPTDDNNTQ